MKTTTTVLLGISILVGAAQVSAQEPQRVKAVNEEVDPGRIAPILPTFKLAGSTDGSAKAKVSADVVLRASDNIDVSIAPSFEVATNNGLATLFSAQAKDGPISLPLRGGGTVTLHYLGEAVPRTAIPQLRASDLRMKLEVVALCKSRCEAAQAENDKTCEDFKKELKKVKFDESMDPQDLCAAGRTRWKEYEDHYARDLRGMYPDLTLSVGAVAGLDSFTYLTKAAGQTSLTLHGDERHIAYELGTSLAWITKGPLLLDMNLTVEGAFRVASGYEESKSETGWCTPAGSVPRKDGSGVDNAELCEKKAYGAPTSSTTMRGAIHVGMLKRTQDLWRFALGPRVVRDGDSYAVGIEAPLYLKLGSAPWEDTGSYKGLIRVVPAVEWSVRGDAFPSSRFMLTLELLGQRSLFGGVLD